MSTLAVVAIGGNSLIRDKAHESVEDQYLAVVETAKHIAGMIEQGYEVIITHGNGPQVGFILRRSEIAKVVAAMHQVLKQYVLENHFAAGSMLPKVQAVINFLENGGKKAIITNPESLEDAIAQKGGPHIYV